MNGEAPFLRVVFLGDEAPLPTLTEVSDFIYDLNLLYEYSRLLADPAYDFFEFRKGPYVFNRTARPIRREDKLLLESLSKKSPLELIVLVAGVPGAAGALWVMVQIFEKVYNFRLNRRKLQAEVKRLEMENAKIEKDQGTPKLLIPDLENSKKVEKRIESRNARWVFDQLEKRLAKSLVRLEDVLIEMVNRTRKSRK